MTEITKSFDELAVTIESSRERARTAVNAEFVGLYWQIGKWLSERRAESKWGDKMIVETAEYLSSRYSDMQGFCRPGLYRMLQFYGLYQEDAIVSPLVTQKA